MDNWEDDPEIRPHLDRFAEALDRFERMMDERDAVIDFIRQEVERFGGKIREIFTDAVDAEFPEFPVELVTKIMEKNWESWEVNGREVTVWLR